jgi:hypothetical protein
MRGILSSGGAVGGSLTIRRLGIIGAVVALTAGLTTAGLALASGSGTVIHGCVNNKTHVLRIAATCGKGETAISWNQQGPAGAQGPQGLPGYDGRRGPAGPSGPARSGAPGPAGSAGPSGPSGPSGPAGASGAAGLNGSAGPSGPAGPSGAAGVNGSAGPSGPAGADGSAGPSGPAGSTGPSGPVGPSGPAGSANVFSSSTSPGMILFPIQAPYDTLTLPNTASYLLFANVTLSNSLTNPASTCQLVDESDATVLDSESVPSGLGSVQVSLTATDTVAAGTDVEVTCASNLIGFTTVDTAGIAAIQF